MRFLNGTQADFTTRTCMKVCLPVQRLLGEENVTTESVWGHQQPSPGRDLWVEVPALELLTQETTQEEAIALYHEVYQLKRSPGEVPCSADAMEETHMEILEALRECLWCRQGPAQPERETRWDTSRIPAQVEFHAQVQATYDYFRCHHSRQCESWEEALWVARDYHHKALATVAMQEGHIEWLSCSITQGQHGSQRQLGSHQQSGSRRHSRSHSCSRSHRRCPLAGSQGETPLQKTPLGMHPGGGWLPQPCATEEIGRLSSATEKMDKLTQPCVAQEMGHLVRYKFVLQSRKDP